MLKDLRNDSSSGALLQAQHGFTWNRGQGEIWEMPQACGSAAALAPHCAIPHVPHPLCPHSALSSACSPRGRLAPGRSWTRTMGTSTALSLLQSELKIPVFLCGVCGRLEGLGESFTLGHGTVAGLKMQFDITSPCTVEGTLRQVLEALYLQWDCRSCILDLEVSNGLAGRAWSALYTHKRIGRKRARIVAQR